MAKRKSILVTEQQFSDLILKSMFGDAGAKIFGNLKGDEKKTDNSDKTDVKTTPKISGSDKSPSEFTELDLTIPEHYETYRKIADNFISNRSSNLLGIRGSMLADAAKNAQIKYKRYVPVELALGQLAAEGGFSKDPKARPIWTKNPFNVGNTDSNDNIKHGTVQSGIQAYYDLIARNYLVGNKTASDLLNNFVNKNGHRYASGKEYEDLVSKIASQVKTSSQPIYASLKKSDSNLV